MFKYVLVLQTTPQTAFANRSAGLTKRSLQPRGLFSAFFSSQQFFSLLTASAISFCYASAPTALLTAAHLSPLLPPPPFSEDLESKPHPHIPLIVRASTTAAVMVLHHFLIKWSWHSCELKCSSDAPMCRCADYPNKLILHMFELSPP